MFKIYKMFKMPPTFGGRGREKFILPKNGINNVFDYYYYVSTTYLTILRLIKQHDWTTSTSLCLLHYVCARIYLPSVLYKTIKSYKRAVIYLQHHKPC